jgi:signal peptidase I
MKKWLTQAWKENKSLMVFICLMLVFRSAVADWNDVPTGSMQPTIVEGDRILVNKLAYDIKVPFTHITLAKLSDPQTNDIIIFDSAEADKRLVKRVIGVPGDIISMSNNQLIINGDAIKYENISALKQVNQDKHEIINGQPHKVRTNANGSQLSNFNAVKVPKDHYLVLGDNRDNSADSRVIGFVPREEIIGRTQRVVMSLDYENYFIPRNERFLHQL